MLTPRNIVKNGILFALHKERGSVSSLSFSEG